MPAQSFSNTQISSVRHLAAFLCLAQHSGVGNSEITNKMHKNAKIMALHRSQKGHMFLVPALKKVLEFSPLCSCPWMAVRCCEYWFGGYEYILVNRWICKCEIWEKRGWTAHSWCHFHSFLLLSSSLSSHLQNLLTLSRALCWFAACLWSLRSILSFQQRRLLRQLSPSIKEPIHQ